MGKLDPVHIAVLLLALVLGISSAMGYNMYQRHNVQHYTVEQALEQQQQINREFAQAINALAARK